MNTNWPELPPEAAAQIDAALARGNKIEAIKLYRNATHAGLKEAKDAIERVAATIPITTTSTTARPQSNLLTIVLALVIVAAIVIAILVATHHNP